MRLVLLLLLLVVPMGQASVRAPADAMLSRGEMDFWLRDHQQFRRTFVGQSRERPR